MPAYPPPPWHTEGYAALRAYRVPCADVRVPPGLTVRGRGEHCTGILAFVRYTAPSPLEYAELIWMPCMVEAKGQKGWYVARMHVDEERTLAAGREVWALPKTMARFVEGEGELDVTTADGSHFALRFGGRGPALPGAGAMTTLQARDGRIVRFAATSRSRVQLGRLEVDDFTIAEPDWESFRNARPLPVPAVFLKRFRTTMHPPVEL